VLTVLNKINLGGIYVVSKLGTLLPPDKQGHDTHPVQLSLLSYYLV